MNDDLSKTQEDFLKLVSEALTISMFSKNVWSVVYEMPDTVFNLNLKFSFDKEHFALDFLKTEFNME